MKIIHRLTWILSVFVLVGLALFGIYFWLNQNSFIFNPIPAPIESSHLPHGVRVKTHDGIELHGWMVIPRQPRKVKETAISRLEKQLGFRDEKPKPVIPGCQGMIYFPSTDREVSSVVISQAISKLKMPQLYLNYRGYGFSQGSPSQDALEWDALSAYDYLHEYLQKQGTINPRICVVGRYLGSYFALTVAASRPVQHLILLAPFLDLRRMAKAKVRWLPLDWVIDQTFDSHPLLDHLQVKGQAMVIANPKDPAIPYESTLELLDLWSDKVPVSLIKVPSLETLKLDSIAGVTMVGQLNAPLPLQQEPESASQAVPDLILPEDHL